MRNLTIILRDLTIKRFNKLYDEGKITSEKLVEFYLERISSISLNAVLEINPDALFIARAMDEERKNNKKRSNLHGVPVIIKGNIDTKDKMQTTGGAKALLGNYVNNDAFLVKKLREAGAVIIGKSNLTEFANFVSYEMPNGYSRLGGQTKNPYGNFDVGGSSSGSAVAVAADFALVSIGTETSGSILSPSSSNSCVGLKPTVGTVSRNGIIPISYTQDTAGPITRTVEDAFEVFRIIYGFDLNDPATYIVKNKKVPEKIKEISDYSGMIFGYSKQFFNWLTHEQILLFKDSLKKVEKLNGKVVEIKFENLDKINNINVLFYEFKHGINNYLKDKDLQVKTLTDVINFNFENKDAIPYGQSILLRSDTTDINEREYIESLLNDRKYAKGGIDWLFEKYNLTALLFPANYGAHITAKAKYPSITVPAGYTDTGPFGLTFSAREFEEEKLFSLAYLFEKNFSIRKIPLEK
ncbi:MULTISPECIES: amidase family protein [unclassified Thermosipho (in: thermotogales)]|uniref:amidase family protein n=1 Tax=unclassified Thermosipho (in: thermotogales) TaxID=2676525 RepID=UPI0009492460|nr:MULTISPECIES: amidase family protein [unclassified Thermosipho (in: thermotogales)]ANQ53046.1 amidase [Thermosipho sp. 1070]